MLLLYSENWEIACIFTNDGFIHVSSLDWIVILLLYTYNRYRCYHASFTRNDWVSPTSKFSLVRLAQQTLTSTQMLLVNGPPVLANNLHTFLKSKFGFVASWSSGYLDKWKNWNFRKISQKSKYYLNWKIEVKNSILAMWQI